MNDQKQKIENIKEMFLSLGNIYKKMRPSQLKLSFQRALYFLQSNKADFKKILILIDKNIKMYDNVTNKIVGLDNKEVVAFWKNIKSIIVDTYFKNKNL